MQPLIPDTTSDERMSGLERFLVRYLGQHSAEFGSPEGELSKFEMPAPLRRFLRFAGRWPGHNPHSPFPNRFCVQDQLCSLTPNKWAPVFQYMDGLLIFVWENQGCWVAATKPQGEDPPVWISEKCSHRDPIRAWRKLVAPLSHFLVSFVLQELMFGSEIVAVAPGALAKFEAACLPVQPVWINGEYAWDIDRPSYFFVAERFLVRQAPAEANGDDWYGCRDAEGAQVLKSLGLRSPIG